MTLQLGLDLIAFTAAWDICFALMSKPLEEDIPRAILEIQLCKCDALKPLFFQIESATANSCRKIYNYLYKSAWAEIDRRQAEVNQIRTSESISGGACRCCG